MKKLLFVLGTMLAFAACSSDKVEMEPEATPLSANETGDLKVNITITRSDATNTRAYYKNNFADGDVIFVFFYQVTNGKYLEMKYDLGSDQWIPSTKGGLNAERLKDANKELTAVYLPYGSDKTPVYSDGAWKFEGDPYSGYFLYAQRVPYTLVDGVLTSEINLEAATPSNADTGGRLIHFDISGNTTGHDYKFYQEYVKPITFSQVTGTGILSYSTGNFGDAIPGYEDGSVMSFSGILNPDVNGKVRDYTFRIDDDTDNIIYSYTVNNKTITGPQYIGLGSLKNELTWTITPGFEYVDLGLSVKWATCNLGASAPEEYGYMYSWAEVTPKTNGWYSSNAPYWVAGSGDNETWSKYIPTGKESYWGGEGDPDNKTQLDPEDDAAHVLLGGTWRMPTKVEMEELINGCNKEESTIGEIHGIWFISKSDPTKKIFLPAAGEGNGYSAGVVNSYCAYWSSTVSVNDPKRASHIIYRYNQGQQPQVTDLARYMGCSIRPVHP